jgi:gas vesicle protein
MKRCSKCKENKALEAYGNLKQGKNGKCSYCKQCAKEDYGKYVQKNWKSINEKVKSKRKEYREDPLYRFRENLREHVRRYIVDKKSKHTEEILGESFDNVRQHIEKQFIDGMSWNNYGEWHIDHIIPLSSGKNREEYIKLNYYTNLQPLWAEDNLRKGAKIIE